MPPMNPLLARALGGLGAAGAGLAAAAGAMALGGLLREAVGYNKKGLNYNAKFPADLNDQYSIAIRFYAYQRQDFSSVGSALLLDTIRLPLPTNLVDGYSINYQNEEVSTAIGSATEALRGNSVGGIGDIGSRVLNAAAGIGIAGAAGALGKLDAASTAAQVFNGIAPNPFHVVAFKSPEYKSYQFSWRLFPRTKEEALAAIKIVETIRFHSLPDKSPSAGGAVLTYPSLVKLQMIAKGTDLYPFKYGVVKNCSFNYAPDGVPSFHTDGLPSAIDIQLQIQEIEYFLKSSLGSS